MNERVLVKDLENCGGNEEVEERERRWTIDEREERVF